MVRLRNTGKWLEFAFIKQHFEIVVCTYCLRFMAPHLFLRHRCIISDHTAFLWLPSSPFLRILYHPICWPFHARWLFDSCLLSSLFIASNGTWSVYDSKPWFSPWIGKTPWRRKWQPTPVLLPGKSHGQRNLVGYSPWGCKELDTTEWLHFTSGYNHCYMCAILINCSVYIVDK